MSEYQFVAFRAIDAPVSRENLEFMRDQSTRAEITPWSFDNEYTFGDFHGDAEEMLRCGFDLHLHYANFGTRRLLIRFSHGLPDARIAKDYLDSESFQFVKDGKGSGGILVIDPFYEVDSLEEVWDLSELLDRLLPLRDEISSGDLRPLYLASLVTLADDNHDPDEETEPPVPAGLDQLTDAQSALIEYYSIDPNLVKAAAKRSSKLPPALDVSANYEAWLSRETTVQKEKWLCQLMRGGGAEVRNELLQAFRQSIDQPTWPTANPARKIAELQINADKIKQSEMRQAAKKAEDKTLKRRVDMANDPQETLRSVVKLVALRSRVSYRQAADLLAELRNALGSSNSSGLAEKQAFQLVQDHPTLNVLKAELKRKGFLMAQPKS